MTTPASKGPLWVAVMAACLPLAACPVAPVMFAAASGHPREVLPRVSEAGVVAYLVFLALGIASLVCAVSVFFMARGRRVPAALAIGAAALPWLVADGGVRLALAQMHAALADSATDWRAMALARGIAESSTLRCIGPLFSAVLLGFLGLALALAAHGRSAQRAVVGAALGIAAAFPMLAGALMLPSLRETGLAGFLPVLPAFAALAGLALAGASASPDAPHARSAALAATAPVAFGLAFVGASVAALLAQVTAVFRAMASIAHDSRAAVLVEAAKELKPLVTLSTWGWVAAAVPVLALGGWALMRGSPVKAPVGEVVAALVIGAVVAGVDLSASRATHATFSQVSLAPWAGVPGFTPVVADGDLTEQPIAALTPDRWTSLTDGAVIERPFDPSQLEALTQAFRNTRFVNPHSLEEEDEDLDLDRRRPPPGGRRVAIAVDARVTPAQLLALSESARSAHIGSIVVVGVSATLAANGQQSPYDPSTWMLALAKQPTGVELIVRRPPSDPPRTVTRVHVDAGGVVQLARLERDLPVLLEPGEGATLESVLTAAAELWRVGVSPGLLDETAAD